MAASSMTKAENCPVAFDEKVFLEVTDRLRLVRYPKGYVVIQIEAEKRGPRGGVQSFGRVLYRDDIEQLLSVLRAELPHVKYLENICTKSSGGVTHATVSEVMQNLELRRYPEGCVVVHVAKKMQPYDLLGWLSCTLYRSEVLLLIHLLTEELKHAGVHGEERSAEHCDPS